MSKWKIELEVFSKRKKKESLTINKLNYVCEDVNCSQQAKAVLWAQKSLSKSNQWAWLYCLARSLAATFEQEGEEFMLTRTLPSSRAAQSDLHFTRGCAAFRQASVHPAAWPDRSCQREPPFCSRVLSVLQGILLPGHLLICTWET